MDESSSNLQDTVKGSVAAAVYGVGRSWTRLSNSTITTQQNLNFMGKALQLRKTK